MSLNFNGKSTKFHRISIPMQREWDECLKGKTYREKDPPSRSERGNKRKREERGFMAAYLFSSKNSTHPTTENIEIFRWRNSHAVRDFPRVVFLLFFFSWFFRVLYSTGIEFLVQMHRWRLNWTSISGLETRSNDRGLLTEGNTHFSAH